MAEVTPIDISKHNLENIKIAFKDKLCGIDNFIHSVNISNLKFIASTSSLASVIGDINRIEYCASNSYLDYLAVDKQRFKNTRLLSINWLRWMDNDMFKKDILNYEENIKSLNSLQKLLHLNSIKYNEGTELFYQLINQSNYNQVAISKLDINKLKIKLFKHYKDKAQPIDKQITIKEDNYTEKEYQIAQIFAEVLGIEKVSIGDDFFRLGGNSILAIKLVAKLNDCYKISIQISDLFATPTIESLANKFDIRRSYTPIIKLNNSDEKTNMFMIHPGQGGCEVYTSLASSLINNFSCYGIDYYNLYTKNKIDNLHELAQYYLSYIEEIMIRTKQKVYHLLGWSLGGQISLEIAIILEQKGYTNIKVYLLDTILKDSYLLSLIKDIDIEKFKNDYRNHIAKLGYDKSYINKLILNMDTENKLSSQSLSSYLNNTKILLFKAMREDTRFEMDTHEKYFKHLSTLKYNNIDKIVSHKSNIKLIEVNNAHHGNILDEQDLLVSKIKLFKELDS